MLEGVHADLAPRVLVGCGAGGVLGSGRELESGTALAVWAASFGGAGEVRPFHARLDDQSPEPVLEGMPSPGRSSRVILLSDPYSFPTEAVLSALADEAPGVPVLGGLSSGRTPEGTAALFIDDTLCEQGAVGVCLDGIEMLPCVSQGAAPLGREVTITAAQDNIVYELAGGPADRDRDRRRQARLRAGRFLGPRRARRRLQLRRDRDRGGRQRRTGGAPARARRAFGRRGSAPGASRPCPGARRQLPGRRADLLLQRPRPGDVRTLRPRRYARRAGAQRRSERRLLRRRGDRPG